MASVRVGVSVVLIRIVERIGHRFELARHGGQNRPLLCRYVHYLPVSYVCLRSTGSLRSRARTRFTVDLWDEQTDGMMRIFRWRWYLTGSVSGRHAVRRVYCQVGELSGGCALRRDHFPRRDPATVPVFRISRWSELPPSAGDWLDERCCSSVLQEPVGDCSDAASSAVIGSNGHGSSCANSPSGEPVASSTYV